MKISAYLIMDEATLPEASAEAARNAGGEWVIVHRREGRQLVSCIAPLAMVGALMTMLAPFGPILVGVWTIDGEPVDGFPVNVAAFLAAMPDDCTATGADDPPTTMRPDSPRDVCCWAGWMPRRFP